MNWLWKLINLFHYRSSTVIGKKKIAIEWLTEALKIHQFYLDHPQYYGTTQEGVKLTPENDQKWVGRYTAIIAWLKQ